MQQFALPTRSYSAGPWVRPNIQIRTCLSRAPRSRPAYLPAMMTWLIWFSRPRPRVRLASQTRASVEFSLFEVFVFSHRDRPRNRAGWLGRELLCWGLLRYLLVIPHTHDRRGAAS